MEKWKNGVLEKWKDGMKALKGMAARNDGVMAL